MKNQLQSREDRPQPGRAFEKLDRRGLLKTAAVLAATAVGGKAAAATTETPPAQTDTAAAQPDTAARGDPSLPQRSRRERHDTLNQRRTKEFSSNSIAMRAYGF